MKHHDAMFIDGTWRSAAGAGTIDVVNPADEQVIATVPAGTAEDVDAAVRAARAALPGWAATAPAERAARLTALRDQLAARTEEIARTITAELGATLGFSRMGAGRAAGRDHRYVRRTGRLLLLRGADRELHGPPRAGRCGRRDHALELPAAPDRQQGRPGARRGLHHRPQARRGHPAHRPALRRVRGRGGRTGRCLQPRHRPRPRRGPGAGRAPGRGPGVLHRLDRRGPEDRRDRRMGHVKRVALELGESPPTSSCRAPTWTRRCRSTSPM